MVFPARFVRPHVHLLRLNFNEKARGKGKERVVASFEKGNNALGSYCIKSQGKRERVVFFMFLEVERVSHWM